MRVFLCEFVTGGGMHGNPLPQSLAREGQMMRDALARDLVDLENVELIVACDARVRPSRWGIACTIGDRDDPWDVWRARAGEADLVWTIAPETDGLLLRLNRSCRAAGARVLGPDDEAVRVASSKALTAERLIAAGLPTPPVWAAGALPANAAAPFVSKPDDGAGCEATRFWPARPTPNAVPPGHVVQPFVPGEAASLTVLATDGDATILSANRQHVALRDGVFGFGGVTVAAYDRDDPHLLSLAHGVCRALPGLDGLFGIDLVRTPEGDVVIEVNPRLTTAYVGLRDSLGVNPLALLPAFRAAGARTLPAARPKPVEVRL